MKEIRTIAVGLMLAAIAMLQTYMDYIKEMFSSSMNIAFAIGAGAVDTSGVMASLIRVDTLMMIVFTMGSVAISIFISTLIYPTIEKVIIQLLTKKEVVADEKTN